MTGNYARIIDNNLTQLFADLPPDLTRNLPATAVENGFGFRAFGESCLLRPDGIFLDGRRQTDATGILISLYALHAAPPPCICEPYKAFKDFPDTMPYAAAFASHSQQTLVPHVPGIRTAMESIIQTLDGGAAPPALGGDFGFVVRPLPKIALCYLFYLSDDDFPASATCLFSGNADCFLPVDGLADTAEYTSRKILSIAGV